MLKRISHYFFIIFILPWSVGTALAYSINYREQVNTLLKTINPQNLESNLTVLTQFPDRYANSTNGVQTADWLKNQIDTLARETGHTDVTSYYVPTSKYKQSSVVVKIGRSDAPAIVIGAHMDTFSSSKEPKPGADDDGSGTVTVMEIARTLLASGTSFKKPIYIIWYAAEEMDLSGSKSVVKYFQDKKIPVSAVLQLDMTGYIDKKDTSMVLISTHTNSDLNNYLKTLIKTYVGRSVSHAPCDEEECSDHVIWDYAGIPTTFPYESGDSPYIHTSQDTMDKLSFPYMTDFVRLGIAFAVELAEPITTSKKN